jgi:hypothetical protein
MDLVAKKLGVDAGDRRHRVRQITSGAVFAAKKCDAGAAAITINDKRKQAATFSDPYFDSTQALLVKSDSGITNLEDLKGKKIGVQTDTTGADYTEKNAASTATDPSCSTTCPPAPTAVLSGHRVDADDQRQRRALDFAKDNPTTKVSRSSTPASSTASTKDNDNTALATKINEVLDGGQGRRQLQRHLQEVVRGRRPQVTRKPFHSPRVRRYGSVRAAAAGHFARPMTRRWSTSMTTTTHGRAERKTVARASGPAHPMDRSTPCWESDPRRSRWPWTAARCSRSSSAPT